MMKYLPLVILVLSMSSCGRAPLPEVGESTTRGDSLQIARMIAERERAMIERDIAAAMDQFSDDATWINSQGYYFEGKESVKQFHQMLVTMADYYYEAGEPRIRILDAENAIAYYSWKMYRLTGEAPADTSRKEIGLMTLSAQKRDDSWRWIAVTNQHTPWFSASIEPEPVE